MPHFSHAMTTSTISTKGFANWCLSDTALPCLIATFEVIVISTFCFVLSGAIG